MIDHLVSEIDVRTILRNAEAVHEHAGAFLRNRIFDGLALAFGPDRHGLPADGARGYLIAGESVRHVAIGCEKGAGLIFFQIDQGVDHLLELVAGEERAHRLAGDHRAPDQKVAQGIIHHGDLALELRLHQVHPAFGR